MIYFLLYLVGFMFSLIVIHISNRIMKREEEKIDLVKAVMYSLASWFAFFGVIMIVAVIIAQKDKKYKQLNKKFRCEDNDCI